jgi:TRAP-type C4-dicarboxylate transport system substrate-binding protein
MEKMLIGLKAWTAGALVAAAVAVTAIGSAAAGATQTFTVVSGLPGGHPAVSIFRKHFRAAVERQMAAAGDGVTIDWIPAYDGTIAKYGEVLEAIRDGVGEIGIVAVDNESKRLPLQDIGFNLPFVTTQCTNAAGAYHDLHKQNIDMNKPWHEARQIYLANITTDGYGLFTGQKIKQVADLRGLKLAIPIRIGSWLSGVAAQPFRMPLGQISGAYADGAIHGAILPITELAEMELERQLNNYLLTEFGPQTSYLITINERAFTDLPAASRDALLAAADQFVPVAARAYCDAGSNILADLKKSSIATQRFYNSRREQWVAALPPLGRMWASAREAEGYAGTEILSAYMDNLRAAGAKPKRDWDRDLPPTN